MSTIIDQTVLSEIQRVTLENSGDAGVSWPSLMWTQAEVLGYLNQRQNRWLAETGLLWTVGETLLVLNQSEQPKPLGWIATIFLAFKRAAGTYVELPRQSPLELDLDSPSWPGTTATEPTGYYEVEGNTLTDYVVPIPTSAGSALERYYVALGTALTAGGVFFTVPDEFVATIKYGALADMFNKVGPAHNPLLVAACTERWDEGIELGRLMAAEGWFAR